MNKPQASLIEPRQGVDRLDANIWLTIGVLFSLFSMAMMLEANMGGNEVDVLPLARQYAQPDWMPNDWYLNQPPGYRLLFQTLFGTLAKTTGFLATSIIGRLLCYLSLSAGIAFIARKLSMKLPFLIFAITLNIGLHWLRGAMARADFYYAGIADQWLGRSAADALFYGIVVLALALLAFRKSIPWLGGVNALLPFVLLAFGLLLAADNRPYSLVANEWYVGGLEAKAVAYALVFPAIALLLYGRYRWMALLLGIATSFHVLAGGYAMASVAGYVGLYRDRLSIRWQTLVHMGVIYLLGASLAIPAVIGQLFGASPVNSVFKPSFIYVFVRLPHHLNPVAWPAYWWTTPLFYLSVSLISLHVIKQSARLQNQSNSPACTDLFKFSLIALIPFALGLIVAPFDQTGALLQYYPFRFGDMFLPFSTCLLFACALQNTSGSRDSFGRFQSVAAMAFIGLFLVCELSELRRDIRVAARFPHEGTDKTELYQWIEGNTPSTATFITPPATLTDFTWRAQRSTIANLKLLPQTKAGIVEWAARLKDLSGGLDFFKPLVAEGAEGTPSARRSRFNHVEAELNKGYKALETEQIETLLSKYDANYFVTDAGSSVDLPVVFENDAYAIYEGN
ncbi:MAG: DUF6798 domain-containing protein [Phormidesmis sp.]